MSELKKTGNGITIEELPAFPVHRQGSDENLWRDRLVDVWNVAFGEEMALAPRPAMARLAGRGLSHHTGWVARADGEPVGYLLAGAAGPSGKTPDKDPGSESAWTDALVVRPDHQGQDIGRALLARAETWARQTGYSHFLVGASPHGLLPGVPDTTDAARFFLAQGYRLVAEGAGESQTLARNLAAYTTPDWLEEMPAAVRPMRPPMTAAQRFIREDLSPTSWALEWVDESGFSAWRGRAADCMALWTEQGIQGICQLTFEDSHLPIEGVFPYRMPRPWGGIGALATAASLPREDAYRAILIDAALRRLHNNGINGCVVGPTPAPDEFLRFGFEPYITFRQLVKELAG